MPGHHRWLLAALFLPQAPGSNPGGEHHRLGIDGLRQQLGRTFRHHRPEVIPQRGRGFVKSGAHHGGIAISGHHANALRALARKNERKRHTNS